MVLHLMHVTYFPVLLTLCSAGWLATGCSGSLCCWLSGAMSLTFLGTSSHVGLGWLTGTCMGLAGLVAGAASLGWLGSSRLSWSLGWPWVGLWPARGWVFHGHTKTGVIPGWHSKTTEGRRPPGGPNCSFQGSGPPFLGPSELGLHRLWVHRGASPRGSYTLHVGVTLFEPRVFPVLTWVLS